MDNHENMSDSKTWALMALFIFLLILIAIGILSIANLTSNTVKYERSNNDILRTEARITPIGKTNLLNKSNPDLNKVMVATTTFSASNSYNTSCAACHDSGVMGAPRFGNTEDWVARLDAGKAAIYANAINGKGSMPARGSSNLNDDQIKIVVDYMLLANNE